ncbi:hypothetical protein GDO86_018480 [Hymenochirus boettgeri]|uniref:Uncharacterized protein n=1 Tax=Hymenochirus boettgeri TaxID=247094 RepID=A0A8T2IFZ9_9PIPI|nr:hypothetical protein GDO86_018480 [Hymenochirus boettgeri]
MSQSFCSGVSNMNVKSPGKGKVSIIGGGDMAIACLLAISAKGTASKLVLIQPSDSGAATDLDIFCLPNVQVTNYFAAISDSKVVVIAVNTWSNSQTYLGVLQSNVNLLRSIVPAVGLHCPDCILLVASQPVEIMTYVTWKLSGLPAPQVLGIGCNLDSQRFQHIIKKMVHSEKRIQKAWIIGEQGKNKVAVWYNPDLSTSNQPKIYPKIFQEQLACRAIEILKVKGQRSWSVGLSISDITDTIVQNSRKVHSVSSLSKGFFGVQEEVFLSIPCVLGSNGVIGTVQALQEDKKVSETLQTSAERISSLQKQLKL